MEDTIASQASPQNDDLSIKEQIAKYTVHWKWFVLSIFITITAAFLYLRYSIPVFSTQATIHVQDDQKGGALSESSALEGLGIYSGFAINNIDNELEVLKSRRLMAKVVKELGLNLEYYSVGKVITTEKYEDTPVRINFLGEKGVPDFNSYHTFSVLPISPTTYKLFKGEGKEGQIMEYGKAVDLGFGEFMVVPASEHGAKKIVSIPDPELIVVRLYPRPSLVSRFQRSVTIKQKNKSSSVVQLTLYHPLKKKAQDIINNLIGQYNKDAIGDRNLIAEHTANFIADRLTIISRELDSVETTKESFKIANNLTDISSEAQLFIESESLVQKQLAEVSTQLALTNNMLSVLQRNPGAEKPLPYNVGIEDAGLETLITKYNQSILERNRILKGATDKNPIVVTINDQLIQLKSNIQSSLENIRVSLKIKKNNLYGQQSRVNSDIATVPQKEKEFLDIERQRAIKEALYIFLLQKREETSISLTVTAPVAKIIDPAYTSSGIVSPNRKMIFMLALLLGGLIPFGIIYLSILLDTKIHNSSDVERMINDVPILGELPKFDLKAKQIINRNDRSVLAESFRILRTNLNYLIKTRGRLDKANVIYTTSSILGEGKTFVAFNLAVTLAANNRKVLLIGADIRNPQLQRYTDFSKTDKGLCEYLYDHKTQAKDIIRKVKENNADLDLILSGRIPPNPAELFMSDRLPDLLDDLRADYDYIVVDTAPTMLVTDTLLISQYADLTLYIVRADYTEKKAIKHPKELLKDGKLRHVAFVVNNVEHSKFGYTKRYDYSYGHVKKGVFGRIKNLLTSK